MAGSFFAAEVLEATAACDAIMAEGFLLRPMAASNNTNVPAGDDPSRQAVTFLATFRDPESKPLIAQGYDPRSDQRPGTLSSHPRIQVTPAEMARQMALAGRAFVIKPSDLVTRLADGKIWRIATVAAGTAGILRAALNLIG